MSNARTSAIVIGASMGGLLAARALSGHFERVTIIERDELPSDDAPRKGVPQGRHAHGLLASGYRVIDGYFPDLMEELEAAGAPRGDVTGDFLWFQFGHWKLRRELGLEGITVSRPCLEAAIRRRVSRTDNVTFLEGTVGQRPAFDDAAGRVTGLVVRGRGREVDETLEADLVVDASGRGSQSPKWLEELGFGRPPEAVLEVDVGYATRTFERRPGDFCDSTGGIIAGTPPQSGRMAAVLAAEGDRWVVTLGGILGDHPETTESGWADFAASLPVPIVHDLVTTARPLTNIVPHRFPANRRRFYEKMPRYPTGYLALGDALCSFNPIYGQGMSVAAMEAKALDTALSDGGADLWRAFYSKARKIVDIPWAIATGEDLRFPQVEGKRPPAWLSRYLARVHAAASVDLVVSRKFFHVLSLLAPPSSLLSPGVVWRVLRAEPADPGSPLPPVARSRNRRPRGRGEAPSRVDTPRAPG